MLEILHLASTSGQSSAEMEESIETIPDAEVSGKLKIVRPEPSTHNWAEEISDADSEVPPNICGVFAKKGSFPSGIYAAQGTMVMVNCKKFDGACHFPADITKDWKQAGESAVLVRHWKVGGSELVRVRRGRNTDSPGQFSFTVEDYPANYCCLLEDHVLACTWNNCYMGYFHSNPHYSTPEIVSWLSLRRGIALDESQEADAAASYLSGLPGPICVLDQISSTVEKLGDKVSLPKSLEINALPDAHRTLDFLIVRGRPDFRCDNGVLTFVTHWRAVFALKSTSLETYEKALRANVVHAFYDFEKSCQEVSATITDLCTPEDINNATQLKADVV